MLMMKHLEHWITVISLVRHHILKPIAPFISICLWLVEVSVHLNFVLLHTVFIHSHLIVRLNMKVVACHVHQATLSKTVENLVSVTGGDVKMDVVFKVLYPVAPCRVLMITIVILETQVNANVTNATRNRIVNALANVAQSIFQTTPHVVT
jgi:hypothetical protein